LDASGNHEARNVKHVCLEIISELIQKAKAIGDVCPTSMQMMIVHQFVQPENQRYSAKLSHFQGIQQVAQQGYSPLTTKSKKKLGNHWHLKKLNSEVHCIPLLGCNKLAIYKNPGMS